MLGVGLGLVLGLGLFFIWWSFWPRQEPSGTGRRAGLVSRLSDELAQAGFDAMTPRSLLGACALAFVLIFLVFAATTTVVPVALCLCADGGLRTDCLGAHACSQTAIRHA